MPSAQYSRHLSDVMARRGLRRHAAIDPESSVRQFVLPPTSESGAEVEGVYPDAAERAASYETPAMRGARAFALGIAVGPRGAQEILAREAERLDAAQQRRMERYERARERLLDKQEKAQDEQRKRDQKVQEELWKFGRDLYKDSGDPEDLHPDDPVREHVGLRGVVRRKQAGLEPGETWKSPTGEIWYGAPSGKTVRSREPRREVPSEFTVGEKTYTEERRLSDINARINELEHSQPSAQELEAYRAQLNEELASREPNPMVVSQLREAIDLPAEMLRLRKKAQIVAERIRELRRRQGQGGTGLPDYLAEEEDAEEEEELESGAEPARVPPRPLRDETARRYWERLLGMGFSEDLADRYVAHAIEAGLMPPDFPATE